MNETAPPTVAGGKPKTSGLAITSLVLGILSIVLLVICLGPLLAIPAVICGHIACSRIRRSNRQLAGAGLALTGLICGYVSIALVLLLTPIAVPNFLKARQTAQATVCIRNLQEIDLAKQEWAHANQKDRDAEPTWDELNKFLRVHTPLVCPAGGTYSINAVGQPPTCTISTHHLL